MKIRHVAWRFARLFAVGLAWGAPLVPAVAVNSGIAVHPGLARPLYHHRWWLFVAMIVLCCLGIAVVTLLTQRPLRIRLAWLAVPLALWLAVAIAVTAYNGSLGLLPYVLTLLVFPMAAISAGVAVTVATLWHRQRWQVAVWLSAWLGVTIFISIATSATPDSGTPGDGMVLLAVIAALLVVTVIAAVLACALSAVPELMEYARHAEQADQANSL